MADFNRVYLIGNLVQDLELKNIGSNNKAANFVMAINRHWTGPEGQKGEEVSFIDCVSFGKKAEIMCKYLSKGRKIFVEGRLKQDKWIDKTTEKQQSRIRVIVENFHFMDSNSGKDKNNNVCNEESVCPANGAIPASAGNDTSNTTTNEDNEFDGI